MPKKARKDDSKPVLFTIRSVNDLTYGSCIPCSRNHKKCDRHYPECGRCRESNTECKFLPHKRKKRVTSRKFENLVSEHGDGSGIFSSFSLYPENGNGSDFSLPLDVTEQMSSTHNGDSGCPQTSSSHLHSCNYPTVIAKASAMMSSVARTTFLKDDDVEGFCRRVRKAGKPMMTTFTLDPSQLSSSTSSSISVSPSRAPNHLLNMSEVLNPDGNRCNISPNIPKSFTSCHHPVGTGESSSTLTSKNQLTEPSNSVKLHEEREEVDPESLKSESSDPQEKLARTVAVNNWSTIQKHISGTSIIQFSHKQCLSNVIIPPSIRKKRRALCELSDVVREISEYSHVAAIIRFNYVANKEGNPILNQASPTTIACLSKGLLRAVFGLNESDRIDNRLHVKPQEGLKLLMASLFEPEIDELVRCGKFRFSLAHFDFIGLSQLLLF